jgi:hypothetical protein
MRGGESVRRDCRCPLARHVHGTYTAYNADGCRCLECRVGHGTYRQNRRRMMAYGRWKPFVDPAGSMRRLQALAAIGWSIAYVAPLTGRSPEEVRRISRGEHTKLLRPTADAIRRVYDELSMTPRPTKGSNGSVQKIINKARQEGWPPPLAWDDESIDDPDASPCVDVTEDDELDEIAVERLMGGTLRRADQPEAFRRERIEAVRRLAALGMGDGEIACRVDISPAGVFKIRLRNDIPRKDTAA